MITEEIIRDLLLESIRSVANEYPPLKFDSIGERALCFRLGLHLARLLPREIILDSEYNYDLSNADPKKVPNLGKLADLARTLQMTDVESRLVTPDFILHARTAGNDENVAVIEVKRADASETESEYAKEKVKAIQREFGYRIGVLLTLSRSVESFADNCEVQFAPFT